MRLYTRILVLVTTFTFFRAAMAAVLGIDFGQQNIKAMVVSPQAPLEIVLTSESKRRDISGLAIKNLEGQKGVIERIYGSGIGSIATRFPKNTLLHLKPLLGKTIEDEIIIMDYLREHPGVEMTSTDWNSIAFVVDGIAYPIEELVAMNIQEIVNRANLLLNEIDSKSSDKVSELAITVPEYFDQYQRQALLNIGSITTDMLKTVLVSDSLSVAISFVLRQRSFTPGETEYYAVYDIGSGSVEASLYSVSQPVNETEPIQIEFGGYGFNPHLGGSTFTLAIANLIENKFLEKHSEIRTGKLQADAKSMAKIVQAADKAKLVLSANSEVSVSIESLISDIDFRTTITRAEFQDFISENVDETISPLKEMIDNQLWNTTISIKDINGVILAGGANRIPMIQEQLSNFIGKDNILRSVNADEAAVNGATIRGTKLFNAFRTKNLNIIERSINSYAINLPGSDSQKVIFDKGSQLPNLKSFILNIDEEPSDNFVIDMVENSRLFNSIKVDASSVSKKFTAKKCPNGIAYNATFSLSHNKIFGLADITAVCLKNALVSNETDNEIENPFVLDSAEVKFDKSNTFEKMIFKNEFASIKQMSYRELNELRSHIRILDKQDKDRFEFHELQNTLETMLYSARGLLDDEDIVKYGPVSEIEELSNMVPEYLEWLEEKSTPSMMEEISSKIIEVQDLKEKIEIYAKTINEPLGLDEFLALVEKSEYLIGNVTEKEESMLAELLESKNLFSEYDLDVESEFEKIKLPNSLSTELSDWNTTLSTLRDSIYFVKYFINGKMFDTLSREKLFNMKTTLEEAYEKAEKNLKSFFSSIDYRVRETQSVYQRKVRSVKRKLQRKVDKENKAKSNSTTTAAVKGSKDKTNSTKSAGSKKEGKKLRTKTNTTSSESQKKKGASSPSSPSSPSKQGTGTPLEQKASTKSSSTPIVHDEL